MSKNQALLHKLMSWLCSTFPQMTTTLDSKLLYIFVKTQTICISFSKQWLAKCTRWKVVWSHTLLLNHRCLASLHWFQAFYRNQAARQIQLQHAVTPNMKMIFSICFFWHYSYFAKRVYISVDKIGVKFLVTYFWRPWVIKLQTI